MVFVGAGHAHLHALRRCRKYIDAGHECVLVAPGDFWYSGLATGVVGGLYPSDLDRIDAGSRVQAAGGRFVRDRVIGLDPANRTLRLAGGDSLEYDVVSLNLGSRVPAIDGEREHAETCYAAKPVDRLCRLRDDLARRAGHGGRRPRVVIAGGGPTAFELAANILGLGERLGARFDVTLVAAGTRMLSQLPERGAGAVVAALERRGLSVVGGTRVVRVVAGGVECDDGRERLCDLFVNATGLVPPPIAREAGLPVDADGAMLVDPHLRSPADPRIFGGGDFVQPADGPIDRVGVYAIRQAPVLFRNTQAVMDGDEPQVEFQPQRKYLWIMNLGDGTGLAARGRLWFRGRPALWLKDRIDRRFLRANTGR